jgi:hypothetical protein
VYGRGIKEKDFYEKDERNDMVDKNIDRIEVDHTKVDDRGPLDLTRQVDETDKRIKELDNSLSIALEINDKFQRENKKLTDKVRRAEAMRRPLDTMDEIAYRELEKENADLKYDNKSLAKQVEDKVEEVKALKKKLEELDSNKD